MQHHFALIRAFCWVGVLAYAGITTSCTDPVRDRQIERLGGEPGDVPQGELHRPGQPCVVCHTDGGPAKSKFAVGGTIFESSDPNAKGASGVRVLFIDASSAKREVTTNDAGNFFLTEAEWPDLTYPFKVGIAKGKATPLLMTSTINREPSCSFCHQPNPGSNRSLPGDDPRASIGQIYAPATAGGGT